MDSYNENFNPLNKEIEKDTRKLIGKINIVKKTFLPKNLPRDWYTSYIESFG